MLLKRKELISSLKLVPKFEGQLEEYKISQKQIMLGSSENCDLVIKSEHVSHYHAIITLGEDCCAQIMDLGSVNGLFLNGEKVEKTFFSAGDSLRIGKVEFFIEEYLLPPASIIMDHDQQVIVTDNKDLAEISYHDLPILPGFTLIDGEPCNLNLSDDNFKLHNVHPLNMGHQFLAEDFIFDFDNDKLDNIIDKKSGESLEITVLSKDTILSVEYLPIKNGTLYFTGKETSSNQVHLDLLGRKEKISFINIKSSEFEILPIDNYQLTILKGGGEELTVTNRESIGVFDTEIIRFSYNAVQIFIRKSNTPPNIHFTSFFERDKLFYKQLAKVFSAGVALMLLLLLVDLPREAFEPKKKISIIYKKMPKKEVVDQNMMQIKQDNLVNDAPKKVKTRKRKGQLRKKSVAKVKKLKKRSNKKKIKKKLVRVDTYKNPLKNQLSDLFKSSGEMTKTKNLDISLNIAKTDSKMKFSSKSNLQQAKFLGKVGDLGKDPNVLRDSSIGAKGLINKKGIATNIMETKTVVLGSMDPEVLRKILQEYLPQFRHCYQKELEFRSAKIKGVVDLIFTINRNGRAKNIKISVKKSQFSKKGTGCMASVLKLIEFPRPKGGGIVDVKQPFNFYSEKES